MGSLIYSAISSLDGYIADENGKFDWGQPDEEVHEFINELLRPIGTHLYGRRLYEVLAAWETLNTPDQPSYIQEFAEIWQAADKIVYSRTLTSPSTARTRIESEFDAEDVRGLKESAETDLLVGGPNLAAHAFEAGLVDECHLFMAPMIVGGGKRFLPDKLRQKLELDDERRFSNGMVHLRYRVVV
jgi:dihydrofolate reductase